MTIHIDVLCVGRSAYDLTFVVDEHPRPDEKVFATSLISCGGGPAANAAVTVARLGGTAVFAGYLGRDIFGKLHQDELTAAGVLTDWIVRGSDPTPVSTIIAKPDGSRALITYQGGTNNLQPGQVDFSHINPAVILFDGHEPNISKPLAVWAKENNIPTLLDAGSLHAGTEALAGLVDTLVCSAKFARQATAESDEKSALRKLKKIAPQVILTIGERGLLWKDGDEEGHFPAFDVEAVDTTGAGDTFHGAFAWCLSQREGWLETLAFASAAAALCCTKLGARHGIPTFVEVERKVKEWRADINRDRR